MAEPADLLLITWNRREYVEKTLSNLLEDDTAFRLYCWDNASQDGTADVIAGLRDPRVVRRVFSKENVRQRDPTLWFLEQATGDVGGKIDDDMLLPHGWTERIAPLVRKSPRFGMLGCWVYMPEDWDEEKARHKIVELEGARVFQNLWLAGQSFLARLETLRRYLYRDKKRGLPINQYAMTVDGLINGYPLPILFAHNMDDPRSPHCLMNRPGGMGEHAALTARRMGFESAEEYGRWIAEDAERVLLEPLEFQLKRTRIRRDRSLLGRIRRKVFSLTGRLV